MSEPTHARTRHVPVTAGLQACGLAMLALVNGACATSSTASVAGVGAPALASTPVEAKAAVRPGQPGEREPGSMLRLPTRAKAGSLIEGRVPVGSDVEAFGRRLAPSADGSIALQVPEQPGFHTIRILRGGARTPMLLRIEVTAD